MKVRNGFVSNSSSSSFIIASREELTKESLLKAFNVDKKSPIYDMVEEVASIFYDNGEKTTIKKLKDNYGIENEEDYEGYYGKIVKKIEKSGFDYIYEGSVGDDNGGLESGICYMGMDYTGDDLIIWKEDGY
jgi:hypothetical protein